MSNEKRLPIKKRESIFDIYDSILDDFERRFFNAFKLRDFGKPSWDNLQCSLEPLMDYEITKDEVIISVDLPKVEKENIEVHASENSIEIEAEMREKVKFERWGTEHHQQEFRCFKKSIHLPITIKPDETTAEFKQGVVLIKAPRAVVKRKIELK
ncbi:MAG: Hsp20/alpha crystallin family protein [Candidatus Helarchaeota archaeon]